MNIVRTDINYNFIIFRQDLVNLNRTYPFLNAESIGNSVLGNDIYCIKLGRGENQVFYSAAFHANEWITTPILMKFVEDFCDAYISNSDIYGYSARSIFNNSSLYIVPMVNPDGVNLVTGLYSPNTTEYIIPQKISNDYPNIPFPNRLEGKY